MSNVYELIRADKEFLKFLPDDIQNGKFGDRRFFWGLAFALREEWATKYMAMVMEKKHGFKDNF